METNLIVMSTDTVDRNGNRMHMSALEGMVKDRWVSGIPFLFGHDQHKPVGWGKPFGLYLEPHITRLIATQSTPVTQEERELVLKNHNSFRIHKYAEISKPFAEGFVKLLSSYELKDYRLLNVSCVTAYKEGIAKEVFPQLFNKAYRDLVVPFSELLKDFEYLGQGVFKHHKSDLAILAHHYFRRSESIHNSLNSAFLDELLKLNDEPCLDLYLRIDENQLGYAPSFKEHMELEYQWGPTYNDDITKIKEGLARHDSNDLEIAQYEVSRTEFLWEWDKERAKFSFQLEELKNEETPTENDTYHCRYVHTVFDNDKQAFEHFDGAVRTYDTEEMLERLDKDFKSYGKKSAYTKLFKINGRLPLGTWKLLVTLYLRGNPLIYEYFGLKKEVEALYIKPSPELTVREKLIPYEIPIEAGLRLMASYFAVPEDLQIGRFINAFDVMGSLEKTYRCIDYFFLEFKKALLNSGGDITIPDDVFLIKSYDKYWNLPLIMHYGDQQWALLNETIAALKLLFSSMKQKEIDITISINLGFTLDDKMVQVSAYGNLDALANWVDEQLPFPANSEAFTQWLVVQRKYLEQYPYQPDRPFMSSIIQFDGVLYAKRQTVDFPYEFEKDPIHGFSWKVDAIAKELEINQMAGLDMCPAMVIKKSICSDTGEDYFTSKRSRWLDTEPPPVAISSYEPMFLHWAAAPKHQQISKELILNP